MARINVDVRLSGFNASASELLLRVPLIMAKYGDVLGPQLKQEIKEIQYPWPNETKRYGKYRKASSDRQRKRVLRAQGGLPYTIASSPRNIVDSGDFLLSQRRQDNPRGSTITFTWDPVSDSGFRYARAILEGYSYVTNSGRAVTRPGRNWIKPALDKRRLDRFFIREWRRLSRSGQL
jgi:hypothetical protein